VREDGAEVYLDQFYDLPLLSVAADASIAEQIAAAGQIEALAAGLYQQLLVEEASSARLGFGNFTAISKPVLIPRSEEAQAQSDASLNGKAMSLLGLRYAVWSCRAYVPVPQLIYAAFRSNANGLLPPSDECLRRVL